MTDETANSRIEQDRQLILDAKAKGTGAKIMAYTKLSGPGWLQSAITLGGGSLAGGLYLGILSGYHLMWLQPVAMIMGVIMLSAIGYVALSTKERPFAAINTHINPVLGWGWAILAARDLLPRSQSGHCPAARLWCALYRNQLAARTRLSRIGSAVGQHRCSRTARADRVGRGLCTRVAGRTAAAGG